jgi:tetratricopeptide (TPR) repeat protein
MKLPTRYVQLCAAAVAVCALWTTAMVAPAPAQVAPQPPPPQEKRAEGKPLDKMPQTADEKAKVLNDLYAHLATANDEQSAKSISETIERLWLQSGSETINLLMERSGTALAAKNPDLALRLLNYVVELAPDYAEGFNRRAYVHFSQNNLESAVGDLRRTLALEPNHFKALDGLGQIWREHGNKKGALRVIKQLLEIHPNWPGAKQAAEELTRDVEGQGI